MLVEPPIAEVKKRLKLQAKQKKISGPSTD